MHKVVCAFCHRHRETVSSEEAFIESPDQKTYICTTCLGTCQRALALDWKAKGGVLKTVKDSL